MNNRQVARKGAVEKTTPEKENTQLPLHLRHWSHNSFKDRDPHTMWFHPFRFAVGTFLFQDVPFRIILHTIQIQIWKNCILGNFVDWTKFDESAIWTCIATLQWCNTVCSKMGCHSQIPLSRKMFCAPERFLHNVDPNKNKSIDIFTTGYTESWLLINLFENMRSHIVKKIVLESHPVLDRRRSYYTGKQTHLNMHKKNVVAHEETKYHQNPRNTCGSCQKSASPITLRATDNT